MMQNKPETKWRSFCASIHTLRFQVIAIMLLCYFIPTLLLGVFTHTVLLASLREKTNAALINSAEYTWTLTTQNIEHTIDLAREAIYDGELADTFTRWKAGQIDDAESLRLSRSYLDRKYSRDSFFTFAAYFPVDRPDLFMYTRSGNTEALLFQQEMQEQVIRLGETLDTRNRFVESNGRLYLIRNLMNLRMERYGMLVLGIDPQALLAPLNNIFLSWPAQLAIQLDDYGSSVEDWDHIPEGLSDIPNEGSVRYARSSDSDDYSLHILLTANRKEQYKEEYLFRTLSIGMYLLLIPILLLITVYVRKRIVKPIGLLSEASRRMEAGELGVTVPMKGGDELGYLGVAFSNMSRRIQELIDKTYRKEIDLKNAQIQALQSRINPHFINNALEDINWQARIDGSETVSAMVSALSVLLNATMGRKDQHIVTLREEMEVAKAYIYFVQQRFGTDLTVSIDVDDRALIGTVPLLTVQPVLENAVEHGIAPAGGGRITLMIQQKEGALLIRILNTGKPLQPEDRQKIDEALQGENSPGHHLGLANIASRLHLIYEGRAAIRVFSDKAGQTVVEITIPQEKG